LRSVEDALGSDRYARLRCGIGPMPESWEMERYVLERFRPEERPGYEAMVQRATEALECCQQEGIEVAMNRYNGGSSSATKEENEKEE
jgi:PTH1 family peptidyl-tRNA hydrolase